MDSPPLTCMEVPPTHCSLLDSRFRENDNSKRHSTRKRESTRTEATGDLHTSGNPCSDDRTRMADRLAPMLRRDENARTVREVGIREERDVERESMEFDVVIVGAGPSVLATAIRLRQLCEEHGTDLSICIVEKGSEVGAHILSDAVLEPRSLDELIPDWNERGAPLHTPAREDRFFFLTSGRRVPASRRRPRCTTSRQLHHQPREPVPLTRRAGGIARCIDLPRLPGFGGALPR